MDMIEALNGSVGDKASYLDYGYFGVLAADFDENGFSTGEYTPKLSYRALQVFASVFREQYELTELPVLFHPCHSDRVFGNDIGRRDVISGSFRKPGGSTAFAYWKPANLMTDTFDGTVTMEILAEGTPRLVDMLDGSVYEIPENMIENLKGGSRIFRNLPVRDYPLLLTFGDFVVF